MREGSYHRISPAEARSDGWQPERRKGPSRTPPPIPAERFYPPGRLFERLMGEVSGAWDAEVEKWIRESNEVEWSEKGQ